MEPSPLTTPLFAYLSPDAYLPMTSVVATVLGVVMMCGKGTLRLLVGAFRRLRPTSEAPKPLARPHFRNQPRRDAVAAEVGPRGV